MIRLSGPRCLAMSVVGVFAGWGASIDGVSSMKHFRALSHEALLSELAKNHEVSLSTSILGGLLAVAAVVIIVDILTRFFTAIWNRIEPSSPPRGNSTPEPAA